MENPYEPPGLSGETVVVPPPRKERPRDFWVRLCAVAILLAIWAAGAFNVGIADYDSGAWRAMGGPFWLMHETRSYALGGTLAVVCLAGMFSAMVWPGRYTIAIGVVAFLVWAASGALAGTMTSDMHFHDTYFDFRIGW